MALYRYYQLSEKSSTKLPDPRGPLSKLVPSSSIASANENVKSLLESKERTPNGRKGQHYTKISPEVKAEIGRRAAEHGVAATIRFYIKKLPDCELKESSVRTRRNAYTRELQARRRSCGDTTVTELVEKKRGRPCLIGEKLDKQVRDYLTTLRSHGAVVNTAIAVSCAEGIIKNKDSNLLASNGGHIVLTKYWGKNLLSRMGFVKRRASTKAKVSIENFEEVKAQFLIDIKAVVGFEEIPLDLIINWDQTGIHYVPVGSWTMEKEGAKRVEIAGVDDKRQITAVFAGSLTGDFLPPQLIYKGTTHRCLPTLSFPPDWHITFSENHWSNESTMKLYVEKIIVPYMIEELKLNASYPALVIFDHFTGQVTQSILQLLGKNHIFVVTIPANCTDRLQP